MGITYSQVGPRLRTVHIALNNGMSQFSDNIGEEWFVFLLAPCFMSNLCFLHCKMNRNYKYTAKRVGPNNTTDVDYVIILIDKIIHNISRLNNEHFVF